MRFYLQKRTMQIQKLCNLLTKQDPYLLLYKFKKKGIGYNNIHQRVPFVEYYEKRTGEKLTETKLNDFKKKHPNIVGLSDDDLQTKLQILNKFNIDESAACADPHVFSMNPVSVDNYGEILKECGFLKIIPNHIIRYHTLVKSNTLHQLKKKGLIAASLRVPQKILETFSEWPHTHKISEKFDESTTNIVTVRMHILQKYLNWKLGVTSEEFEKYCSNYLPFRHKPMLDVQEAIHIAQNDIKLDVKTIRRNGFIISADPVNTKNLIENVPTLAGLDIKEAIKREPGLLKNNYKSILDIHNILEEHSIPEAARRHCLRVFCLSPRAVHTRLHELRTLPEYQVLATNPRVLMLVVHKRKAQARLGRIAAANKLCYSLNHLVASAKIFNEYIGSFGNKTCSRDVAILVHRSLARSPTEPDTDQPDAATGTCDVTSGTSDVTKATCTMKDVAEQLSRHKFWLHTALSVIDGNIRWLRESFSDDVILLNCQLLLYPRAEIQHYVDRLQSLRSLTPPDASGASLDGSCEGLDGSHTGLDGSCGGPTGSYAGHESSYAGLDGSALTDAQLLSLALYELERRYHFTGDGIWARHDKLEASGVR